MATVGTVGLGVKLRVTAAICSLGLGILLGGGHSANAGTIGVCVNNRSGTMHALILDQGGCSANESLLMMEVQTGLQAQKIGASVLAAPVDTGYKQMDFGIYR